MNNDNNSPVRDFINNYDDHNEASDLISVVRNIFMSCDSESEGHVQVSKIIDFVTPFLQENKDALEDLKICLGKNDEDSTIDIETFYQRMDEWTRRMLSLDSKNDFNIPSVLFNMGLERNNEDYIESTSLNLSTISSCNDGHEHCLSERTTLKNHIKELQHQKRRMSEEVSRMRSELTSCHEQNESLQGNLDKVFKKLVNEQKLNVNLQMERKKDEDLVEQLSCAKKHIVEMEKLISSLEKENNQLQQQFDRVQSQKRSLEERIGNMKKKSEETISDMLMLQSEIDLKKHEVIAERKTNVSLLRQNQELCDIIEQRSINIEKLKLEKEALEKLFREQVEKNESLINLNMTSNSLNRTSQSSSEHGESPSLKANNSIDDQLYGNIQISFNGNITENLQDEMSKPQIDCNCQSKLKVIEVERKLSSLQCELMEHEECSIIISQQKDEIQIVSRENDNYKEQLEKMKESLADLNTQLSLNQDKESLLLDRCQRLEDRLKNTSEYVTEMQTKIEEYTNLENKCKDLSRKIEELETDNSMKYVKIVNLTVEIEKLRQILAKTDQQNKEELTNKIDQLEEERKLHEKEKNALLEKIKTLNEEKMALQAEKERLLSKIVELETERETLSNEKENLQVENFGLQSKKDTFELEMAKYQNEMESLEMEKDSLKTENINLEIAKEELENDNEKRLEQLNKRISSMEMEKRTLLEEISVTRKEKQQLENDVIKYKDKLLSHLELRKEYDEVLLILEDIRNEHESIKNNYEMVKNEARETKERMAGEIFNLKTANAKLLAKNDENEKQLVRLQKENQYYLRVTEELNKTKQKLSNENNEFVVKNSKNETNLKKMDIENKQLSVDLVNVKLSFDKLKTSMKMYEKLNENLVAENRSLQKSIEEQNQSSYKKDVDINQLREACQNYENDLKTLKKNLEESQKLVDDLEKETKNKERLLCEIEVNLGREIRERETERRNMEKTVDKLQKKLEETSGLVNDQKETETRLRRKFDEVSEKLQEEMENHDYLLKRNTKLENELFEEKLINGKLKEETVQSKEIIAKLENRIMLIEKENEILNKEKISLKNISEENNNQLLASIKSKMDLTERHKKLIEENTELSLKCTKLSDDLVKKSEMLEQANVKANGIWNELKKTEKKILEKEQEHTELFKREIEKSKSEIGILRGEKETLVEKLKMLEEENSETKEELEKLLMEKDQWLTEKIESCKKETANPGNSKSNAENRMTHKTNFGRLVLKNMKLDDKIFVLEEQLVTEKQKNTEMLKELASFKDQNIRLLTENVQMKKKLESIDGFEEERKVLQDKIENLIKEKGELIKIREACDERDLKLEELISKIGKLEKENETLKIEKENLNNLKEDYERLQKQCIQLEKTSNLEKMTHLKEQLKIKVIKENSMSNYLCEVKDRLSERRLQLWRATFQAKNVLRIDLEENFHTSTTKTEEPTQYLKLDEEILQMEYQIYMTTNLLDQLTSLKSNQFLMKSISMQNIDSQESLERQISPNSNRHVLKNLGLMGDVSRNYSNISFAISPSNPFRVNSFSKLEENFTTLVLTYIVDKSSLRQKCHEQKNQLRDTERSLAEEISTLSIRLKDRDAGEDVSSHLEHILNLCTQISISAEQYGSLRQQDKLSKAVETITNYVADLRERNEKLSNQCLSIKSSPAKRILKNDTRLEEKEEKIDVRNDELEFNVCNEIKERCCVIKKSWTREVNFIITLSISVFLAVVVLSLFESSDTTLRMSPLPPPT